MLFLRRSFWKVAILLLPVTPVYSQSGASPLTDSHPGADSWNAERRSVGIFQNDFQRQGLRGYQDTDRRPDFRNPELDALTTGGISLPRANTRSRYQNSALPVHQSLRLSFDRYGGFGERRPDGEPGDVRGAFARRYGLVEATSLNAPVRRALLQSSFPSALPSALSTVPFVSRPSPAADVVDVGSPLDPQSLDLHLQQTAVSAHLAARSDAWAWFLGGNFRRAARGFQSAITLNPADTESYVGEMFCHLSNGATRTALATLSELARREPNPFVLDLDMRDRYATTTLARQVGFQTQAFVQDNSDLLAAGALHAFVLWFIGERAEAMRAASTIARDHPGTPFADWPAKMARAASQPERSQP